MVLGRRSFDSLLDSASTNAEYFNHSASKETPSNVVEHAISSANDLIFVF
jgi:hypothetical protein